MELWWEFLAGVLDCVRKQKWHREEHKRQTSPNGKMSHRLRNGIIIISSLSMRWNINRQGSSAGGRPASYWSLQPLSQWMPENQDPNRAGDILWQWRWPGGALTSLWAETNNRELQRLKDPCLTVLLSHWFMGHGMRQGEGDMPFYSDGILLCFQLDYCCQDNRQLCTADNALHQHQKSNIRKPLLGVIADNLGIDVFADNSMVIML